MSLADALSLASVVVAIAFLLVNWKLVKTLYVISERLGIANQWKELAHKQRTNALAESMKQTELLERIAASQRALMSQM